LPDFLAEERTIKVYKLINDLEEFSGSELARAFTFVLILHCLSNSCYQQSGFDTFVIIASL
jgi:hypothetical protein